MRVAVILVLAALLLSLQLAESRRRTGGGGRSRSSGSRRTWGSSIFGRKKSKNPNPQSSYPKQQYKPVQTYGGNYGGSNVGSGSNIGGGGFVAPKKNSGGSNIGGGGFVAPKNNYGRSNIGGGGFAAPNNFGGRGYVAPKYNAPKYQYGQSHGRYGGGNDMFGKPRGGLFSGGGKKAFALGAGAGFVGGAVAGIAAMQAYHTYRQLQMMLYYKDHGYYGSYGERSCFGSCPVGAYCDFGICRCNPNREARYGHCFSDAGQYNRMSGDWQYRRSATFDPFKPCTGHQSCFDVDINLYCNTNSSKCECRHGMKWNKEALECQVYMDVDCSGVVDGRNTTTTTTSTASPSQSENLTEPSSASSTEATTASSTDSDDSSQEEDSDVDLKTLTPNKTLADSKLAKMDVSKTSKEELKRQFCTEVKQISDKYAEPLPIRQPGGPAVHHEHVPESKGVSTVTVIIIIVAVACVGFVACFLCKKKKRSNMKSSGADSMNMGEDGPNFQTEQAPMAQYPMHQDPNQSGPYSAPTYQPYPPAPYQQAPYPASSVVGPPTPGAPAVPAAPGYAPSQPPMENEPSAPYPPPAAGANPPYPVG